MIRLARFAAVLAALGVVTGALGAHFLKEHLANTDPKASGWWETAAHYHLVHAIALFAIAVAGRVRFVRGWWTVLAGMCLFSGSLYLMALTGSRALPIVLSTPLGGVLMITGWILVAIACREGE